MSAPLKILLVDDNDELRSATQELMEEMGYLVTVAARGRQALELFTGAAAAEPFDLLVTDVFMPGWTGLELAEQLLKMDGELAVLFFSSRGDDVALRRRLAEGDVAFLSKPFSAEELETKIAEALDLIWQRRPAGGNAPSEESPIPLAARIDPAPERRWISGLRRSWALAATVVLSFGAGMAIQSRDWGAPLLPEQVGESVRRSASIEAVTPVGPATEPPHALRWLEVPGADRYLVSMQGVDQVVWWQAESDREHIELPLEVAAEIHRAVTYYWSVQAFDSDQRLLASSGPIRFSIDLEHRSSPDPNRP